MNKLLAALAVLTLLVGTAVLTGPANASDTNVYSSPPNQGTSS